MITWTVVELTSESGEDADAMITAANSHQYSFIISLTVNALQ